MAARRDRGSVRAPGDTHVEHKNIRISGLRDETGPTAGDNLRVAEVH